jgi:hypothetical protein
MSFRAIGGLHLLQRRSGGRGWLGRRGYGTSFAADAGMMFVHCGLIPRPLAVATRMFISSNLALGGSLGSGSGEDDTPVPTIVCPGRRANGIDKIHEEGETVIPRS